VSKAKLDAGSFRDPSGCVYLLNGRVFRIVTPYAAEDFKYVRSSGLTDQLIAARWLVPEAQVGPNVVGELGAGASYILEHPRLPFISYPYEWSFSALKAAALRHLDIHLQALDKDVTLSDATAYNIQFQGPEPIFIDHLSFRRYRQGEFWDGHGQFCQQFLNPLLLRSICGIPHNSWYRGSQEGITVLELNYLLPLRSKFSWNVFIHVTLQARLQNASTKRVPSLQANKRGLPKTAFRHMLERLQHWIACLQPADTGQTVWSEYSKQHSYSDDEAAAKKSFVAAFVSATKPAMIWDLGCNTGDYSKVALETGAGLAIGFDSDQGALELAYARAIQEKLNFLPLFLDAANPTPNQGWAEQERRGLATRSTACGLLALAVVHHLAIARNIPLDQVVGWLMGLAPAGVIEFVPKSDAMVQRLLQLRKDIFTDYNQEAFLNVVRSFGRIIRSETVSQSGRLLVWYQRD
jgi:ribosomal protein L11 methylase PrmA